MKFPISYQLFLKEFGAGDIFGVEIYGIIQGIDENMEAVPNAIWLTEHCRKKANLPRNYVIVGDSGNGYYYILETTSTEKEGNVFLWQTGDNCELVAINFDVYLTERLKNMKI